jgi:hypothetical protein
MIVAFMNSRMDGLNTFAYSLAMAEHYRLTIRFFMVDDQSVEFFNNLDRLPENLKEFILEAKENNCFEVFAENEVLRIRKELYRIKNLDAIIFANDYIKRFGHLQLFQDFFNLPIPLLLIKHDTIFKPVNDLFKKKDIRSDDKSEEYEEEENNNLEVIKEPKVQSSTNYKKKMDAYKSINNTGRVTEEVAASYIIREFNNQSRNTFQIKEKKAIIIITNADLSLFLAKKPFELS